MLPQQRFSYTHFHPLIPAYYYRALESNIPNPMALPVEPEHTPPPPVAKRERCGLPTHRCHRRKFCHTQTRDAPLYGIDNIESGQNDSPSLSPLRSNMLGSPQMANGISGRVTIILGAGASHVAVRPRVGPPLVADPRSGSTGVLLWASL